MCQLESFLSFKRLSEGCFWLGKMPVTVSSIRLAPTGGHPKTVESPHIEVIDPHMGKLGLLATYGTLTFRGKLGMVCLQMGAHPVYENPIPFDFSRLAMAISRQLVATFFLNNTIRFWYCTTSGFVQLSIRLLLFSDFLS